MTPRSQVPVAWPSLGCQATCLTRSSGLFQSLLHPLLPTEAALGPSPTQQTLHLRRCPVKMPVILPGEEGHTTQPPAQHRLPRHPLLLPRDLRDTLDEDPKARACGGAWSQPGAPRRAEVGPLQCAQGVREVGCVEHMPWRMRRPKPMAGEREGAGPGE